MYKLLIVEDEYIIRNTLATALNWEETGCKVIGASKNGAEALELLQNERADIIVTDIKMDEMDGIELCMEAAKLYPNMKFIIITGYGEFDYAKSALKLGVKDFILKPIEHEELLNAVRKAAKELDFVNKKNIEFQKMKKTIENNLANLRENFFLNLLSNKELDDEEISEKMEFLEINLSRFYVISFEIDRYSDFRSGGSELERHMKRLLIRQNCIKIISKYSTGYIIEKEDNLFCLIIQTDETDVISLAEEIQNQIQQEVLLSISIGISEPTFSYSEFLNAFYQSTDALKHKYYLGDGAIISISDVDVSLKKQNVNFQNDYILIIDNIKVGDCRAALQKSGSLMCKLKANMPQDLSFIPNMAAEFIISLQRVLIERNIDLRKILPEFNLYNILNKCNTLPDIELVLTEFINKVTAFIQSRNRNLNCAAVKRVDDYIKKYYHMDITLNDLSKEVYLNPNYLGRLIKKETGKNFSDILTEIRIEKAKELMKNTQIKTYEISERVGINDSRYFSQLFKKITGMTPTEYRNTFI